MRKKSTIQGNVPSNIISILQTIENNGFEAFIVGGAVRDLFLGKHPTEYDLTSNARPSDIQNMFDKTTNIGEKFGTIGIIQNKHIIEVTTYRKESKYTNGRHPQAIDFANAIEDDLPRRDFTINAIAYNPLTDQIIDLFDGQTDIKNQRLKCIGNPTKRFNEDLLRPFRCFRFASQLGFHVDSEIIQSLKTFKNPDLPSIPRIRHEMDRLILGNFWVSGLKLMDDCHWLNKLLPAYPIIQPNQLPKDHLYRWAWLFSKTDIVAMGKKLQFSRSNIRQMRLINEWEYDQRAIELSIHDIQISTDELITLGYQGKSLGMIQKELLTKIRQKKLINAPKNIRFHLKNRSKYLE